MIGKIMKNSSFKATAKYVIEKQGAQIIGGNMVMETPDGLAAEFAMSGDLKPMIKHPVYHFSLSLPPTESLTDEQFSELATQYLTGMGLDEVENQYFVARHTDTDHDHVHIVASRINVSTGTVIDDGYDRYHSQIILRDLERQYSLTVLENSWEVGRRAESISQIKKGEKTGIVSVQKRLQDAIEKAAIDSPTMPKLIERLQDEGIGVRIGFTRTGKTNGISYVLDDVPIAGNKLGNRYSFPGLSKHLNVSYEAERDNDDIRELCLRVVVKLEEEEIKIREEKQSEPQVEGEAAIDLSPPQVELPSQAADSTSSTDSTDSTDEPPSDAADEQPPEIALPVVLPPLVVNELELEVLEAPSADLLKVEPQPEINVISAQQELADQKQVYLDLWQQIEKDVIEAEVQEPEVLVSVAIVALRRGHTPDQVVQIVGQSPTIQKVLKEDGQKAAQEVAKEIVTQAFQREQERAKALDKAQGKGTGGR